jgi:cell division septum initiation protein DivIVA
MTATEVGRDVAPGAGAADASRAAARLLELAARDAEQWRSEANALVDEARVEADRLVEAARAEAAQLVADARDQADTVRADLDQARAQHQHELDELSRLQDDYRNRIRGHLNELLHVVDKDQQHHDQG